MTRCAPNTFTLNSASVSGLRPLRRSLPVGTFFFGSHFLLRFDSVLVPMLSTPRTAATLSPCQRRRHVPLILHRAAGRDRRCAMENNDLKSQAKNLYWMGA